MRKLRHSAGRCLRSHSRSGTALSPGITSSRPGARNQPALPLSLLHLFYVITFKPIENLSKWYSGHLYSLRLDFRIINHLPRCFFCLSLCLSSSWKQFEDIMILMSLFLTLLKWKHDKKKSILLLCVLFDEIPQIEHTYATTSPETYWG